MLNKFKRFLSLLCAIVILIGTYGAYLIPIQSVVNAAETVILDLDEDVKYFGRTFYEYNESGKKIYKFSWANSGFQFSFKGKEAKITLQGYRFTKDNPSDETTRDPYVKIYINGELATTHNLRHNFGDITADNRIRIEPDEDNIITISNLKEGNYTIKVVKCTDGYYNGISLSKIRLTTVDNINGEILATKKYYDRQMLIIGDTLVSGYGTLATSQISKSTVYSTEKHEDSTLSFAAIAADAFGAENMTVALRNRGIVKNSDSGTVENMHLAKDFFEYLDFFEDFNKRSAQYDHTQYNPDVVVISLGFHDAALNSVSAATFKPACKDFILQVKSAYPDAKIVYAYGFLDGTSTSFASTIKEVISELNLNGYDDVFYVPLSACDASEKGYQISASYYMPTKDAHAKRAEKLILAIEDITDWKSSISESVPVTDDMPSDTLYRPSEDTDFSIMSLNVMDRNAPDQEYLAPSLRAPLTVQMIKSYMPDIICVQEASKSGMTLTIEGSNTTWADYITNELKDVGYDCKWLTDIGTYKYPMDIGSGLITFWKKDRFVYQASDAGKFAPLSGFPPAPSQGRYWTWVQLKDKQNADASFYVYNTHIYNESSNNDTIVAKIKNLQIEMIEKVASSMHNRVDSNGNNQPVLFAGDFVRTFSDCDPGKGLYNMESGSVKDAAHAAPYTRQCDPERTPNHIFFNDKTFEIRELHELYESVEGRRLSSQEAIIAHFNYKGNVSFTGGTLSDDKSLFTDVSNSGAYSLRISVGADEKVDVYKDNEAIHTDRTGNLTLSLPLDDKKVTRFTLRIKDGNNILFDIVNIYITRTDSVISSARPTVSATNTVNSYFANGAWHLLASKNEISNIYVTGGELYFNPYATRAVEVDVFPLNLKQGRTVLYVKSSSNGDVYPVYIYRQTHTQSLDSSVLYVDDDFCADANGVVSQATQLKVAFYDGERVIFVDATRAFAKVEAAVAKANELTGCNTIYFGSGNYNLNQEYNGDNGANVKFTDDVILLGSNYDISAVEEHADRWYAAGRRPESIINGGFYFEKSADISVTVKGFKFQGQTGYGALRFADTANSLNSSIQTLDIQNNVFMSSVDLSAIGKADSSDRGIIVAESQAKVTGIIKDNYFKCVQNNYTEANASGKAFTEALYLVNLQDMLIEQNFFLGYQTALNIFDVKETQSATTSTSYAVYSNRFEHCGSNINRLFGVGENDKVYIAYRNNDFVRSGSGSDDYRGAAFRYAIDMYLDDSLEGYLPGKYFTNITLDIIGNRFMECSRSLRIRRTKITDSTVLNKFDHYDVSDMTVNFIKNSIVNPMEYNDETGYFHSVWLTSFTNGDMTTYPKDTDDNDKWDFSGNYCYSTYFDPNSQYNQMSTFADADDFDLINESAYGVYDLRTYMRNYSATKKVSGNNQETEYSIYLKDSNFTPKVRAYDRVVKAFEGAVGSFEEGWKYDFDHIPLPDTYDKSVELGYEYDYISDIADMDFLRGTTPLSDKMTALDPLVKDSSVSYDELKKIKHHSMLTTEHLTGEMRGQSSFYSDVRWYCRNRVSFDIRTTYTGDQATFFYKYSNGAMPEGNKYDTITNEQFYNDNESDVDGIILKFKTEGTTPTIEMWIYNRNSTTPEKIKFTPSNSAVTDMREFNHIDIIEKEIGTMDFYVNGKCFARVVGTSSGDYSFTNGAIANTTNSSNAYYNTVTVYEVEQNDFGENIPGESLATVSNASVTKQSAIAFSSAYTNASATADDLWPEKMSMEIDNLEIVDLGVGKLTIINNIAAGILYKAWNMTDCVYNKETKTYTYTVNSRWIDFFTKPEYNVDNVVTKVFETTKLEDGTILLTLDRGENNNPMEHDNEDMVALAKAAVKYAIEKDIEPVGIDKAKLKKDELTGKQWYQAVIPLIDPGCYVVNSTLGSLITTDTLIYSSENIDDTDGLFNLTVYEKNDPPKIEKFVYEDNTQNTGWKFANDASIGEEVKFKLLVTVQDGAYGYTIKDTYGLNSFENIAIESVKIYENYDRNSNSNTAVETYVENTHYTVNNDTNNGVLTVKFASSSDGANDVGTLENVPSGNVIEVIYTATVHPSAPIEQPITTSALLSYGRIDTDANLPEDLKVTEQFKTPETSVNTYLWSVNLFKYTEVNGEEKALSGAEFALCTDQAGSKKLSFIGSAGNYRVAASGETGATTKLVDDGNGRYTIKGLDSGIYYLVETEAPSGYLKMQKSEAIAINATYGVDVTKSIPQYDDYYPDGTAEPFWAIGIKNQAGGFELPATGEEGRKLFIATGSALILSMGILLVTRMRSSKVIFIKTETKFKVR